tara:strand:+ start:2114 stop:2539 length:426 start_codon:yes stop_codon:yes gene_type:complete
MNTHFFFLLKLKEIFLIDHRFATLASYGVPSKVINNCTMLTNRALDCFSVSPSPRVSINLFHPCFPFKTILPAASRWFSSGVLCQEHMLKAVTIFLIAHRGELPTIFFASSKVITPPLLKLTRLHGHIHRQRVFGRSKVLH